MNFPAPITITLDGSPVVITGTHTGSYVSVEGRTWLIPEGETPDATAAGILAHIEAAIEIAAQPDLAAIQAAYDKATEDLLNQRAASWGYVSMSRATTYAASTNPQWAAEAVALIAHRDAIWQAAYDIASDVVAGNRTVPALSDYLAELPAMPARPGA